MLYAAVQFCVRSIVAPCHMQTTMLRHRPNAAMVCTSNNKIQNNCENLTFLLASANCELVKMNAAIHSYKPSVTQARVQLQDMAYSGQSMAAGRLSTNNIEAGIGPAQAVQVLIRKVSAHSCKPPLKQQL